MDGNGVFQPFFHDNDLENNRIYLKQALKKIIVKLLRGPCSHAVLKSYLYKLRSMMICIIISYREVS